MDQGRDHDVQQPADSAMDPGMAPAEPNRDIGEPQPGQITSREQGEILPNEAPVDIHCPQGNGMQIQVDEEQVGDQRRDYGVQQLSDSAVGSGRAPGECNRGTGEPQQGNEAAAGIHSPQGDDEDDNVEILGNEEQPLLKV